VKDHLRAPSVTDGPPERRVRRLDRDDLPALLDLYTHLHSSDAELDAAVAGERWDAIVSMPGHSVLGVEINGALVASCSLQIVPNLTRGGRPYGLLENVVVHGDHRRRGIGADVVQRALAIAWERDCYKVMLMTGRSNEGATAFYEAIGFDADAKRGFVARP
jgi:ribosomal protein S18 acetylase RimI-like enzyme